MCRRHGVVRRRENKIDPVFKSKEVAKFIRCLMSHGKLSVASKIINKTFEIISRHGLKEQPLEVFEKALKCVSPTLIVKPRRVGGAVQQVPVDVDPDRAFILARQWLIEAARNRNEKTMAARLAAEILAAYQNTGAAIKKREDNQKMAKSNNVFAPII